MYRIRSLENLIGSKYKELEKQEIFFSDLESLNDPLEGFRVFYWSGDIVLWENLLKHYTYSLYLKISELYIFSVGNDSDIINLIKKIPIPRSLIYKDEKVRIIMDQIYEEVLKDDFIKIVFKYFEFIDLKKVYEDELNLFLEIITMKLYIYIINSNFKNNLIDKEKNKDFYIHINETYKYLCNQRNFKEYDIENIKKLSASELKAIIEGLIEIQENCKQKFELDIYLRLKKDPDIIKILMGFSKYYINSIKYLAYNQVYTCSFMEKINNASVWATYGDNHKGVCLKYKENNKITLFRKDYFNENTKKYDFEEEFSFKKQEMFFKPIIYTNDFNNKKLEIDFFNNLGTLLPDEMNSWFINDKGKFSSRYPIINNEWRENYWKNFEVPYLRKGKDWENEKEYRLLIDNTFYNFREVRMRLFKYDFNDLEAIIFGNKTPIEDRAKIINIIEKKCKENNIDNFNFYKMEYNKDTKEFQEKLYHKYMK